MAAAQTGAPASRLQPPRPPPPAPRGRPAPTQHSSGHAHARQASSREFKSPDGIIPPHIPEKIRQLERQPQLPRKLEAPRTVKSKKMRARPSNSPRHAITIFLQPLK